VLRSARSDTGWLDIKILPVDDPATPILALNLGVEIDLHDHAAQWGACVAGHQGEQDPVFGVLF